MKHASAVLLAAMMLAALPAVAQEARCGGFPPMDNGPHDYRKVRDRRLLVVETHHFTKDVESLRKGASTTDIGADIAFTLRHFPNHHRALLAMAKLGERMKTLQVPKSEYPIDCWFDRATRFASDDHVSHMLYAQWLAKNRRLPEALSYMAKADALGADSPLTLQSLGLLYLELGQPALALERAHRAYALGLQSPMLRDALKSAGHWAEPAAAEAASAPASSASD